MNKEVFARNLKNARDAAGMTQAQLAEKSGCQQGYISKYENEIEPKLPELKTAVNLANALGISLDTLCGEDEKSKGITAFQWLRYLDDLIDNPPSINSHPLIQLRITDKGTTEIVFSGNAMQDFFKKYAATNSIKKTIGDDLYNAAIEKLFDDCKFYFTPGYRESVKGANTPHLPPIF